MRFYDAVTILVQLSLAFLSQGMELKLEDIK